MMERPIDIAWVVVSAALVFLMQPGFLCLETGLTRSKHSINVAVKNMTDFGISVFLYWCIGFGLMFGTSWSGVVGSSHFFLSFEDTHSSLAAFFLFQAMFCGTATTIVSGAVAERMRFSGYLLVSVLLSGFLYCIFGHWAWASTYLNFGGSGWLQELGFRDFAGATVVHSVGGWVALAATIVIGPRCGRFNADGTVHNFTRQNVPLAALGVLLLWIGWFGFNGGSTLEFDRTVAEIIVNTTLAGCAGMLTALAIGWRCFKRPDVDCVMNGSLAGLVAITANCDVVSAPSSVLIGSVGAVVMMGSQWALQRFRIDDVVGAIPVHAGAGVWGTLAVALFGDLELLGTGLSRFAQIGAQLIGVMSCFCWAFAGAFLLLRLLNLALPLRVSPKDERRGLNVVEHGQTTELLDLLTTMDHQAGSGDFTEHAHVEQFTDVGQVAELYNRVLDKLAQVSGEKKQYAAQLERSNRDLKDFAYIASHELHAPLRRVRSFCELLQRRSRTLLEGGDDEFTDIIVKEVESLQSLVDDLLSYARVEPHGKSFELTDCNEILKQTVIQLDVAIRESGAQITCDELPIVHADSAQLVQLFQNLVGNAIKYCESQPRIHVASERCGDEYRFSVLDNGIGIPVEHAEDVFLMMKRLHSADDYPGSGLGLAICRRIVERHGGRIWIEPDVEQGSLFRFSLPIID